MPHPCRVSGAALLSPNSAIAVLPGASLVTSQRVALPAVINFLSPIAAAWPLTERSLCIALLKHAGVCLFRAHIAGTLVCARSQETSVAAKGTCVEQEWFRLCDEVLGKAFF